MSGVLTLQVPVIGDVQEHGSSSKRMSIRHQDCDGYGNAFHQMARRIADDPSWTVGVNEEHLILALSVAAKYVRDLQYGNIKS